MKKLKNFLLVTFVFSVMSFHLAGQQIIRVIPKEINDVLTNPGIGFTTFQRFNGDSLNNGITWTEGLPIKYQKFNGNLENKDYPMTSIAYFRVYWKYLEPEIGQFNWAMIDSALITAHNRHQTLMLRIAPYGSGSIIYDNNDAPTWYRAMVGDKNEWIPANQGFSFEKGKGWRVDPEDPRYAQYFGRMITELGKRYDGHPELESIDLSIVGHWGEGKGSRILSEETREVLVNAYTDNFKKTPLIMLLTDEKTNKYCLSQANVGWRVDCIGDLGFWAKDKDNPDWAHMYDWYPQGIINFGMQDAWEKAPVSFEICGTFKSWKGERASCNCQGYDIDDVNYIINETLKWHISSFNAKSSAVPKEWQPLIDQWLNKMGYRFVLRNFSYPSSVARNEKLAFKSWWENKGVAPIYKKNFLLAIRLQSKNKSEVLLTDANIVSWLPGDNIYDDAVIIPPDLPTGIYQLQIGIVDRQTHQPKVSLAIEERDTEGWYSIGKVEIK